MSVINQSNLMLCNMGQGGIIMFIKKKIKANLKVIYFWKYKICWGGKKIFVKEEQLSGKADIRFRASVTYQFFILSYSHEHKMVSTEEHHYACFYNCYLLIAPIQASSDMPFDILHPVMGQMANKHLPSQV